MGRGELLLSALRAVNRLLRERRLQAALATVKGFRNGAVYGAKIRAPHALVMTFLFKSGSLLDKLKAIAQATYTHSRNLAIFVFLYKGVLAAQQWLQGEKSQFHSFFAACMGGWFVFGDNNHINSQIPSSSVFYIYLVTVVSAAASQCQGPRFNSGFRSLSV